VTLPPFFSPGAISHLTQALRAMAVDIAPAIMAQALAAAKDTDNDVVADFTRRMAATVSDLATDKLRTAQTRLHHNTRVRAWFLRAPTFFRAPPRAMHACRYRLALTTS
jgi:hypothetical protein